MSCASSSRRERDSRFSAWPSVFSPRSLFRGSYPRCFSASVRPTGSPSPASPACWQLSRCWPASSLRDALPAWIPSWLFATSEDAPWTAAACWLRCKLDEWKTIYGGPRHCLRQILQRLLDQPGRPSIRIARAVPFHGKITFVSVLFCNSKGSRQIHVRDLVLLIAHFRFLHVRNAVGMPEHRFDPSVGVMLFISRQCIRKIRQRVQPLAVHRLNHLDEEKWIFAHGVVVLQMHHHVLRGPVL